MMFLFVWFPKLEHASDCKRPRGMVIDINMAETNATLYQVLKGRLWAALCGMLLVLCVPWGVAGAAEKDGANPHISKATRLYEDFKYTEALRTLEKAARWPSNTPEQNVFIALLEGVLRFETHQPEKGERAFTRALTIDPKAQLSITVSPKISETLEEIRQKVSAAVVPEVVEPTVEKPEPTKSSTVVISQTKIEPPSGLNLSRYRLPIAVAGGGLAVVGILSWTRAKSLEQRVRVAEPSITTRAQLDGTLNEGRTFETVGWVLLGTGAATAIGSFLLLDAPASAPSVLAAPTDGGAQVSFQWRIQ